MKNRIVLFLLYLVIYINTQNTVTIDISRASELPASEYYEIEVDDGKWAITITLLKNAIYEIQGSKITQNEIDLVVTKSCTLIFNDYTAPNSFSPLVIKENCEVSLITRGTLDLNDDEENTYNGVIQLGKGAKLTINNEGGEIKFRCDKVACIYAEENTSIVINNANIEMEMNTEEDPSAGIYSKGNPITFNNVNFYFSSSSDKNFAIKTDSSITINKGTITINSPDGKGITCGTLELGEAGGNNSDLTFNNNNYEGLRANTLKINSGKIILIE